MRSRTPLVETMVVKGMPAEDRLLVTGTLLPAEEVELQSEVSGRIVQINFNEGSAVRKGDLLVKLKDDDLVAQLKKARYQEDLAGSEEFRKRKILESKGISQEEYDQALSQLNIIKADIELLESRISDTEIRAPFDGVIGLRMVSTGAYVTPSTLIATLQQNDPMKVEFSVPERYASRITKGMEVLVLVGETGKAYKGQVFATDQKVELNTRTLRVRALCSNKDRQLVSGSFARVELLTASYADALMIPSQALIPKLNGQMVYVVKENKSISVDVNTGLRTDTTVMVTSGLHEGDSLILTGLLQIKDGGEVKIAKSGKQN
jgi:membrane fusion protein (multidrug efflux system)